MNEFELKLFQQRVMEEKSALDDKLTRLTAFINHHVAWFKVPKEEQDRLKRQAQIMKDYSTVLGERIAAFK